ncbi:MAG: DEAD/DEAH box helicase [Bacteroidia bacterium]|nr:DEAD/DEAH box helicase [Bacteroidia bacterium]
MTFQSLKLADYILKAIQEEGYEKPTPVQSEAIPIVLSGRDLLACAQTGTGKTAAFAIPMIQLMQESNQMGKQKRIRGLVVTPTRELAIQIHESFGAYGRHTGIKQAVIFGGVKQESQVRALKAGIDLLIATPGRLLDLIQQGYISLKDIEFFVLDEADRMLDMGFIHDVKKIIKVLPQRKQSLFFSATMPDEITKLANVLLYKPGKVEVTPVSSTAETINQKLYYVEKGEKNTQLLNILDNKDIRSILVFTRTKHGADKVVKFLIKSNVKAMAIHGNKSQNARQNALNGFKDGSLRVLVATDIAARGIDVEELEWVLNYELPNIPETYVHRIGRTGRAGNKGSAISFCAEDERPYLKSIEKLIRLSIPKLNQPSFSNTKPEPTAQRNDKPAQTANRQGSSNYGYKKKNNKSSYNKRSAY